MAHREYHDASGVLWEVWEAHPTLTERRRLRERRALLRPTPERRTVALRCVTLPLQLRSGWLAFRSKFERRRLVPVPDGWDELEDEGLARLLVRAQTTGAPRRLIE